MGTVIEYRQVSDEESMISRLLVYFKILQKMMEPKFVSKDNIGKSGVLL